ncbi:AAA family ATPase [Micromonospora sp. NPDC000316]|uniref:AAA family ATPase n=1 Tax=Micromonospora sp. NPDC000316 TaxID=3364216 RepID=UPI0036AFB69A
MMQPQEAPPLMRWNVPSQDGTKYLDLSVHAGETLVFVGPNGAGKSALSFWMSVNKGDSSAPIVRVIAHRRIWLSSAGAEMTTSQRTQTEATFEAYDSQPNSRTTVVLDEQRSARVLYDLLAKVNMRNALAADRYDRGEVAAADDGVEEGMLAKLERVFAAAGMALRFRVADTGGFDAVTEAGTAYPISQMSDGEKGAFLLASEALLAPPGSVLLVDEPERHLHRSISSDFIVALTLERPDAGFILFTHDLDLLSKLDATSTTVCTVSAVSWNGPNPSGWAVRIEQRKLDVPDSVRQAILGGRSKLLFVEGEVSSLDFALYRLLFPDRSVVPCGGGEGVKRAVAGLNESESFHWVDGRGVLDGDARSANEVAAMAAKKILVLPVNEVENLYYLSWIVDAVAEHQGLTLGEDGASMAAEARGAALRSLNDQNIKHLASENAIKVLRQQAMAHLPGANELMQAGSTVTINLDSTYQTQEADLRGCIDRADYDGVLERFSVRSSGFLTALAKRLRFLNHDDYEKAVRSRLLSTPELLDRLRTVVGELP